MRAAGTAFGTMVNFIMSFIIGQFFLTLMCHCKAYVFLFFAGEYLNFGGRCELPFLHGKQWQQ
jgi:hypothetical protein